MKRIDSHFHLWSLSHDWQTWPTVAEEIIFRDFGPDDFRSISVPHSVESAVLVQSSEHIADTENLLKLAGNTLDIAGVVGWVDFQNPMQGLADLKRITSHKKLCGLRPMLQSMRSIEWLSQDGVRPVIEYMIDKGHVFDALIKPHQITDIATLATTYSDLKIVVDHAAKPNLKADDLSDWSRDIERLSDLPNVHCKVSGLMTEAPLGMAAMNFRPLFNRLVKNFGFDRLLWGSDWPVVNLSGSYTDWICICEELMFGQPVENWKRFFYANADALYSLNHEVKSNDTSEKEALV